MNPRSNRPVPQPPSMCLDLGLEVLGRHPPGRVGCPCGAHIGTVHDQTQDAVRVCRSEQSAERASIGLTEQDRPRGAGGVHHGDEVIHLGLEVWKSIVGHSVRQPHAALVEDDEPGEGRETAQETGVVRRRPVQVDVGDPSGYVHQVDRAFPHDLISDMDAIHRLGVAGLGHLHRRIFTCIPSASQRPGLAPSTPFPGGGESVARRGPPRAGLGRRAWRGCQARRRGRIPRAAGGSCS